MILPRANVRGADPPMDLAALRTDYMRASLDVGDVDPDPYRQFARWFDDAYASKLPEVNAMTLATVGDDGRPSARIVLLKSVDARGFSFYTNRSSRKGRELDARPHAALLFFWAELERQVRIEGRVDRVADAESDAYFANRPRESQVGAWASPQSEQIPDRVWLERAFEDADRLHAARGDAVARPPYWGGYTVLPSMFEFWQGRASRLHDRIVYRRERDAWSIGRLAP
jgi:pyridoxamine 5'-phosphate oxidase